MDAPPKQRMDRTVGELGGSFGNRAPQTMISGITSYWALEPEGEILMFMWSVVDPRGGLKGPTGGL